MESPENQEKIIELFKQGPCILDDALTGLSDFELDYMPSNGGWTIRQIIHHIADGDDLWKTCIKIALGNEQAEFTLKWYSALSQTEWAIRWRYESRSIGESLALLKANRDHLLQLLEYVPDGWTKTVQFREPNGEVEVVPVGAVFQMQADHVVHHVKRILEIRQEISSK
ncbi:MAG: DinB family protein [Ignavibacteriaceae bacterium]